MLSDKMKSIILAGAMSADPRYREAAQTPADEERYMLQAQALGETQVEELKRLARSVGPKTTLPNHDVWPAVWSVMLANLKQGAPAIPENPIEFARAIWREMYHTEPWAMVADDFILSNTDIPAFLSLVDAVKGKSLPCRM